MYQTSRLKDSTALIASSPVRLGLFFTMVLVIFSLVVSLAVFHIRHYLMLLSLIHCFTVSDSHIRIPSHTMVNIVAIIVSATENTPNHAKIRDTIAAPSVRVLKASIVVSGRDCSILIT